MKLNLNVKTYKGAALFFIIMALGVTSIHFLMKKNIEYIISSLIGFIIGYILVCICIYIYTYYKNK